MGNRPLLRKKNNNVMVSDKFRPLIRYNVDIRHDWFISAMDSRVVIQNTAQKKNVRMDRDGGWQITSRWYQELTQRNT
jgi:hypothetical protein